eukprot:COSAG03_NODE_5808_length_1169_cov_1.578505_1_plen_200_part_00
MGTCLKAFIRTYSAACCSPYTPRACMHTTTPKLLPLSSSGGARRIERHFTHPFADQVDRHLLDRIQQTFVRQRDPHSVAAAAPPVREEPQPRPHPVIPAHRGGTNSTRARRSRFHHHGTLTRRPIRSPRFQGQHRSIPRIARIATASITNCCVLVAATPPRHRPPIARSRDECPDCSCTTRENHGENQHSSSTQLASYS